jgi:hypothetical protein
MRCDRRLQMLLIFRNELPSPQAHRESTILPGATRIPTCQPDQGSGSIRAGIDGFIAVEAAGQSLESVSRPLQSAD